MEKIDPVDVKREAVSIAASVRQHDNNSGVIEMRLLSLLARDRREMAERLRADMRKFGQPGGFVCADWLLSKAEELERPLNHTIVSCKRQEEEERP